ncbi:uncharacterized protein LOC121108275 [Gallus gallus]|uniref:uncharacterized protein LOC121108275 n=1 Tax=Gallus gallus TaxID=9031 RepID=UPI001AE113B4|nr:uncharacterized protein LOC121108275 [Gallus gallus]XP_046792814.1 uncharacterized protein LOC121108275 [Gallus gallus]
MDQVIKVLVQFCKDYFGKCAPSRKEIAAVLSLLNELGELDSPRYVLDSSRWDLLTSVLCQRAMASQKATELKTWGLILGALKAARVEGKVLVEARYLLGLSGGGETQDPVGSDGGSGAVSCRGREETEPPMTVGGMAPAEPTALSSKEDKQQESESSLSRPPPPYPNPSGGTLYPLSELRQCYLTQGGGGSCDLHGQDQLSAHMGRDQTEGPSNADRGHSLLSLVTPRGGSASDSVEEKEGTGFECRGRDQMTDWNGIRSEALGKGIVPEAFRVIVSDRGPEWVPPDPGGVTRLVEFMDKRGLKSPLTLNALQTLAALGPLFPRDITNLMRTVLRLVQYTLWETDWVAELGGRAGATGVGPHRSLHGTGIQRLSGKAVGVASPQGQLARLRPGELIAATDAVVEAFNKLVHKAEPPTPCTDITQGPNESFQSFTDRLLAAAEGSDLLVPAQGPVIIDCLQQKSHDNVKALLRAGRSTLNTSGEVIQYVLDKLKVAHLTNERLVTAIVVAVGLRQQRSLQQQGLCFRYGQYGHVRAQCPCGGGQSGPPDHRKGLLKGIRGRVCSS